MNGPGLSFDPCSHVTALKMLSIGCCYYLISKIRVEGLRKVDQRSILVPWNVLLLSTIISSNLSEKPSMMESITVFPHSISIMGYAVLMFSIFVTWIVCSPRFYELLQ